MQNREKNQNNQPVTKKEMDESINEALQEQSRVILDVLDGISGQIEELKQENKMNTESYKRHDEKLENHEERIKKLETSQERA